MLANRLLLLCVQLLAPLASSRPNVIIMQPDDFEFFSAWTPPAHFPSRSAMTLNLPNIERLRQDGLEMLRAYAASPMCGTSRYSTITGRYPSRSSISRRKNKSNGNDKSEVTIPTTKLQDVPFSIVDDGRDCSDSNLAALFSKNQYATGMIGKWHLTSLSADSYDYATIQASITDCGFDTAEAIYYENLNDWTNGDFTHNMEHMTEEAIKFIDEADANNQDFFLYFNPTAPHSSGNVYEALTDYSCTDAPQGTLPAEPVVVGMTAGIGCASYRQTVIDRAQGDTTNAVLGSIWVDDAVGALLQHLESKNKLDSTIFLFQMDHGQEGKGSLYEPGTRIAQFIHYPDGTLSGTYSGLVSTIDIGPTMADFAGFTESSTGWYEMDGVSWRNLDTKGTDRCLVLELDFDRAVVCGCDKYLAIGNPDDSSTVTSGQRNGVITSSPAGFDLCENGRDYTTSPRTSTETDSVSVDSLTDLSNLLGCHLSMTDPDNTPEYGICDSHRYRTPAPTTSTVEPTTVLTPSPTETPACTCSSDASIEDAYYEELIDGSDRIIRTNGIPSHVYHHDRERENPNRVCLHPSELTIPLEPQQSADGYTAAGLGVIGILKTGAFLYNHQSNRLGVDDVANHPDNEQPGLDGCHGHAGGTCQYHYHEISKLSSCTHDNQWDQCELIGWLRDGFPIYSHCRHPTENRYLTSCYHLENDVDNGEGDDTTDYVFEQRSDCDLDEANGYEFSGSRITDPTGLEISGYGYIVSDSYPYVMAFYRGTRFWPLEDTPRWTHPTTTPPTLRPTSSPSSRPTSSPTFSPANRPVTPTPTFSQTTRPVTPAPTFSPTTPPLTPTPTFSQTTRPLTPTPTGTPTAPAPTSRPATSNPVVNTLAPTNTLPTTLAPTFSAPTSQPVLIESPSPPSPACFSGLSLVQEHSKGTILMSNLQIGDFVESRDGEFSRVYSFGHRGRLEEGSFWLIETDSTSLEISSDHLIFSNGRFIRSMEVRVGDILVDANNEPLAVRSISKVKRTGVFAPLTESGFIMVSGVLTSNYVAFGNIPAENMHNLSHMLLSPFRAFCRSVPSFCEDETYDSFGYSNLCGFAIKLAAKLGGAPRWLTWVVILVGLPALVAFFGFEVLLEKIGVPFLTLLVVIIVVSRSLHHRQHKRM